jgi:ZIP family zinc transporter
VLTAVLYGLAASSALVIGALIAAKWEPPKKVTGVLLAFASGALISALAFELFGASFHMRGALYAGIGLLAGAATFVIADTLLDRYVGGESQKRKHSGTRTGVGLALLAAVTLDGIPENLALGVSLVGGASMTLLIAIFFSNLPEALVGGVAMRKADMSTQAMLLTWVICAVLLAAAVVVGRVAAGGLSEGVLAVTLAFAGGAVLASLADTLMPEAFEHGRPLNAFATAGGFFLSFVLSG